MRLEMRSEVIDPLGEYGDLHECGTAVLFVGFEALDDFLLFCYTDGLTETANEKDEEYGQESLIKYFEENHNKDLNLIHQDIIVRLDGFKGRNSYRDDITMLSCRVQ